MNLNKAQVIGRVGRDPELRFTPDGSAICQFSVATNRNWTDSKGEKREQVEWHSIVAWRTLAEQAARLAKKGRLVYVEGHLETRTWEDKDSGKKMYRTEIVADVIRMMDAPPDQQPSPPAEGRPITAAARPHPIAASQQAHAPVGKDRFLPDLDDTPF